MMILMKAPLAKPYMALKAKICALVLWVFSSKSSQKARSARRVRSETTQAALKRP
jgi:hypothetical protein